MNILFLTMGKFASIEAHSIYADLLRCFRDFGHEIYAIVPYEKKTGKRTELAHERGAHILHIETGNVTGNSNLISKGLAQVSIEPIYTKAIKRYFSDVKFDLVMYSTPPVMFGKVVEFVKKRDGSKSYLLLKDIFPQNAVDLGIMKKNGVKGLIYRYFRRKEKRLYALSDYIGCMSEANVQYVLDHNSEVDPGKLEICPNAVEVIDRSVDEKTKKEIREKYDIPHDKTIFIYGGNLGKPQGIPFLIECLRKAQDIAAAYFLIIGSGSEYGKIQTYVEQEKPANVKLINLIPKEDYDSMVGACDVGLIFLDHRFTIPNFPSRLLAYMQASLPVLACTDPKTDVGRVITEGGFGWWCESNDTNIFCSTIKEILNKKDNDKRGKVGFEFLKSKYSVENAYGIVMKQISFDAKERQ